MSVNHGSVVNPSPPKGGLTVDTPKHRPLTQLSTSELTAVDNSRAELREKLQKQRDRTIQLLAEREHLEGAYISMLADIVTVLGCLETANMSTHEKE